MEDWNHPITTKEGRIVYPQYQHHLELAGMKKVAWARTHFDRYPGAEEPPKKKKGISVVKNSTEEIRNGLTSLVSTSVVKDTNGTLITTTIKMFKTKLIQLSIGKLSVRGSADEVDAALFDFAHDVFTTIFPNRIENTYVKLIRASKIMPNIPEYFTSMCLRTPNVLQDPHPLSKVIIPYRHRSDRGLRHLYLFVDNKRKFRVGKKSKLETFSFRSIAEAQSYINKLLDFVERVEHIHQYMDEEDDIIADE